MPVVNHALAATLSRDERWPPLPLDEWRSTRDTLHLWTQIVGKLKVELSPFQNQLWQTSFALTARGLTTQPIPHGGGVFQADFDFVDHHLTLITSDGGRKVIPLYPRSVADFYNETMSCLQALGIVVQLNTIPQELPAPIPFDQDTVHDSYDSTAVNRWWRATTSASRVMWRHRSWFTGKASAVHFYWGSFDLTATRHNGDPAPPRPEMGYLYRVAENEANWAGGFWSGGGPVDYAAFYAYMIPQPGGLPDAVVEPESAFWSAELSEFLLPYDDVRTADDPEAALLAFLESTFSASANLAGWDREKLELTEIPRPR